MKRIALALTTLTVVSIAGLANAPATYAAPDFDELRRENLDKDAVEFDELRRENLDKDAVIELQIKGVDLDELRRENLDKDAISVDELGQENLEKSDSKYPEPRRIVRDKA